MSINREIAQGPENPGNRDKGAWRVVGQQDGPKVIMPQASIQMAPTYPKKSESAH